MTPQQAEQVNAQLKDTATRRVARTFLQLLVAGAFTELFRQIASDVGDGYAPYVMLISTLIVVAAQNYLENQGVIPPILGTKADVKG